MAAQDISSFFVRNGTTYAQSVVLFGQTVERQTETMQYQTELIERQMGIINSLRQDLADGSSFKSRAKEWLISGAIGAILGQIVSIIAG